VSADPGHRAPVASDSLDGSVFTNVLAQDSYVNGVPSINYSNFTYPIRESQTVKVSVTNPGCQHPDPVHCPAMIAWLPLCARSNTGGPSATPVRAT
jgi:hypothetical protein